MTVLQKIRARVLALRSSVHNENCLSAIELAGMCAKKTNELIDVVNTLCAIVENLTVGYDLVYDPETESLDIKPKGGS